MLDLGQYIPGPYAAQILADLGAEVVKVEPPAGDPMRAMAPFDDAGVSLDYAALNAGKTVVALDLKAEAGREAFAGLLGAADVLIESYRPGTLDRLEFPRERIAALNPALVHVSLSGWGQTGPYRDRAGHDVNYMALAGGLTASGPAAGPAIAYPPTADHAAGLQAALAAIGALFGRLRRGSEGGGRYIDLSIMESVLAWQSLPLNAVAGGHPPERRYEVLNGGAACYQVYRTRDARFVTLGALEEKFWAAFCQALGEPGWIPRQWEPLPQRDLIEAVATRLRRHTLEEWQERLADVDCCFEPVWPSEDLLDHPHLLERGMIRRGLGGRDGVQVLSPFHVDGGRPAPRPRLAEADAGAVLARWREAPAPAKPKKGAAGAS